ncbi:uncharacterized protein LOC131634841 [Vicia villosa]|uniref:uncharacterized protein LOC131634841 n=1 Tax=Vicia villosa TaxID=3911 RepID=UPI00273B4EB5|nr:uncharacterized protein LOC131634841 [Vicia villosa]
MEKIFRVMDCTPSQKVRYENHTLAVKADDWWLETRRRLEAAGEEISWVVFHGDFMRKYYSEDVRDKKEIEFLELKQGNKSVVEYAYKFVELAKFYPHYNEATVEISKCIKFKNGLRFEIKKAVGYQKIHVFADLVDCCRIYEEDSNAHYKMVSERRKKQKATQGKRTSWGDAPPGIVCFKCGKVGHKSNVCNAEAKRYFRCGKFGHALIECMHKEMVCFKCGEEGHIGSKCQKPKKEQANQKVFALSRTQTTSDDALIRVTCFINSIPLITINDTGATHCFISVDFVERLGLVLSAMNGEMVVDTLSKGSVTTSLVCLMCPLSIFDRDFIIDFVCLPLRGLNVISSMNWLEHTHVHINCYDKLVRFSSPEEKGVEFLSARQVRMLMKEEVQVFALVASMSVENQAIIDELKVVCEFLEVFHDEIPDVLPEREVGFSIDLVPGTIHVSMAPYMMSA